jgi:tetratricopeptide (TPR) repeat protein
MARLYEDRKQVDEAIRQYEFIVKYAFDRDADIYLKLGKIYQAAGRLADARRVLAKGKRIFPSNAEIFRLYQDVYSE